MITTQCGVECWGRERTVCGGTTRSPGLACVYGREGDWHEKSKGGGPRKAKIVATGGSCA